MPVWRCAVGHLGACMGRRCQWTTAEQSSPLKEWLSTWDVSDKRNDILLCRMVASFHSV